MLVLRPPLMGDIPEVSDGGQSRLSHLICAGKRGRGSRNGPYAIFVALERRRGLLLNLLIDTIEADRYRSRRASGSCAGSSINLARWDHCRPTSHRNSAAMHRRRRRAGQHSRNATRTGRRGKDGDRAADLGADPLDQHRADF